MKHLSTHQKDNESQNESHNSEPMHALKLIVRYIERTANHGLYLYSSSTTTLISYTYADWGGYPDIRRSTSSYCVLLGDNPISWASKWQATISQSRTEVEH